MTAVGLGWLLPIPLRVRPRVASIPPLLAEHRRPLGHLEASDEACKSCPQAIPCPNLPPSLPSPSRAPCPVPGRFPGATDIGTHEGTGPSPRCWGWTAALGCRILAARGHWGISGKKTKRIYHK